MCTQFSAAEEQIQLWKGTDWVPAPPVVPTWSASRRQWPPHHSWPPHPQSVRPWDCWDAYQADRGGCPAYHLATRNQGMKHDNGQLTVAFEDSKLKHSGGERYFFGSGSEIHQMLPLFPETGCKLRCHRITWNASEVQALFHAYQLALKGQSNLLRFPAQIYTYHYISYVQISAKTTN